MLGSLPLMDAAVKATAATTNTSAWQSLEQSDDDDDDDEDKSYNGRSDNGGGRGGGGGRESGHGGGRGAEANELELCNFNAALDTALAAVQQGTMSLGMVLGPLLGGLALEVRGGEAQPNKRA